jgi:hypothetical protein
VNRKCEKIRIKETTEEAGEEPSLRRQASGFSFPDILSGDFHENEYCCPN